MQLKVPSLIVYISLLQPHAHQELAMCGTMVIKLFIQRNLEEPTIWRKIVTEEKLEQLLMELPLAIQLTRGVPAPMISI